MTLPLLAPRSTYWANGPYDTNVLQINRFYAMNVRKLLKLKEKVIQMKSEIWSVYDSRRHYFQLPLLVPRSTDWANGPFDTNILQNNICYAMNVRQLLKKEKLIQIKSEIWSVWVSNTQPYRY